MKTFVQTLKSKEDESATRAMAFMAYNPAIGRVLRKGGVDAFCEMAVRRVAVFRKIDSAAKFDAFHASWAKEIVGQIARNARGGNQKCSYGQAQKPINVFLKLFVDWAHRPDSRTAARLLPFLHVPLDSIVMTTMKKEYAAEFAKHIRPLQGSSLGLANIDQELYLRWQALFRSKNPNKPILFDVAWSTGRKKTR